MARVKHHPALPYAEIGAFMPGLRGQGEVAARALELTVLCAARSSETIGANWVEVDFDAGTWIVPGGRMKAGRDHKVPLSDRAWL